MHIQILQDRLEAALEALDEIAKVTTCVDHGHPAGSPPCPHATPRKYAEQAASDVRALHGL